MDARSSVSAHPPARRLGTQERLFHLLHRFGGLVAVQVLHVRGRPDADLVRRGLDDLQRRYPLLGAHIRPAGLSFYRGVPYVWTARQFVTEGTEAIPLSQTSEDWRDVLRRELRTPLGNGRRPRARAVLAQEPTGDMARIVLTLDHAIADVRAAALAGRALMEFLADPDRRAPVAAGLPPALDAAYPEEAAGGAGAPAHPIRLPRRARKGVTRQTLVEIRDIDADATAALKAAAQASGATLHGTVAAAVLTAAGEHYGLARMSLLSTFELRQLCRPPLPAQTFGCYIDVLRTTHELGAGFWALAREVGFRLIGALAKDRAAASILRPPAAAYVLSEASPTIASGWRLDGLGLTTGGDLGFRRAYGPFVLEDATMAVSMHAIGPGLFASTLEREGALSLTFCYAPHAVPQADALVIADRSAALLCSLPR